MAKGKSSGSQKLNEEQDNYYSVAKARLVDALSEGTIQGFVDTDGRELVNAVLAPTVVSGVLRSVAVQEGSNYRFFNNYVQNDDNGAIVAIIPCAITTTDGQGSGAQVNLSIYTGEDTETQHGGDIIEAIVVSGGSGYTDSSTIVITAPPIIGKAIYFDNIPLQPGTFSGGKPVYNFTNVRLAFDEGTPANVQALPGFEATETVVAQQGTELLYNTTQTIQFYGDYDFLNIGIRVGALYVQDINNAAIKGSEVTLEIRYQYSTDGTSFQDSRPWPLYETTQGVGQGIHTIKGKASSPFVYTISGNLPRQPDARLHTWRFTITRTTAAAADNYTKNDIYIDSMTAVQYERYSYPYTAKVGMEINAEQFTSIPTRSYLIKGLRVKVPTNYFPAGAQWELREVPINGKPEEVRRPTLTGTYNRDVITGVAQFSDDTRRTVTEQIWDGRFYYAWTNNPAWCFYDILTNTRYGLGNYVYDVDKWALYSIARYCDELVDDGYGGYEPRFTCNCYIQTREAAYKVVQDLASVFAGMTYWYAGMISVAQDRPGTVIREFNQTNVKGGVFTYSGTSLKARHSSVLVSYNEPTYDYKLMTEYVEDIDTLLRCGIRQLEFTAFACTSRGQAVRLARKTLLTEKYASRMVNFTTGTEGYTLQPGQLITIRDPAIGTQYAGRLASVTRIDGNTKTKLVFDRGISATAYAQAACPLYLTLVKPQFFLDQATVQGIFEPSNLVNRDKTTEDLERNAAATAAGLTYSVDDAAAVERVINELQAKYTITLEITWSDIDGGYAVFTTDVEGRTELTLTESNWTELPLTNVTANAVWGLTNASVEPATYRVLNVSENEKIGTDVTAVLYDAAIYTEAEDFKFVSRPVIPNTTNWVKVNPVDTINVTSTVQTIQAQTRYLITASWEAPKNSFVSEYEIYFTLKNDEINQESQKVVTTPSTVITWPVVQSGTYEIAIYARGPFGGRSTKATKLITIASATGTTDERIYGLEIQGQGNTLTFDTPDIRIAWKENSAYNVYEFGNEPDNLGAEYGQRSPDFKGYLVTIGNSTGKILLEKAVLTPYFILTGDDNMNLAGAPYTTLTFKVKTLLHSTRNSIENSITVTQKALAI